ncbi:MAG: hypothetical protein E7439_03485 [Ruminococcaceae bacterium]|nr:hypothetical protein [Oscillospiraceae bacterium]
MQEIDYSVVSAVMSSVTAVIAIVAPIISSIVAAKSQERMKRNELYAPRVYDALAQMSLRYSLLPRISTATDSDAAHAEYLEALDRHSEFMASCYTVMSLVPGETIQEQITALLASFEGSLSPDRKQDKMFCQLMNDINEYLRTSKIKKQKQNTTTQV